MFTSTENGKNATYTIKTQLEYLINKSKEIKNHFYNTFFQILRLNLQVVRKSLLCTNEHRFMK